QVLVFDKTGTLTQGRPSVTEIFVAPDQGEKELLRLVAAAERGSEHPFGKAMVQRAVSQGIKLVSATEFRAIEGCGIEARVEGRQIRVGTWKWIQQFPRS